MRQNQIKKLRSESELFLLPSIEQLELKMQALDDEATDDKELRHLARLLYVGQLVEQADLLYSLNEHAFCHFLFENKLSLQNPLDKRFENENSQ